MSIDEILKLFGNRRDDLALKITMNEAKDGLKISYCEPENTSCYNIELIAGPDAVDSFIASKMVFWFRNEFKVLIDNDVKQYTSFEKTRRYFTKRMLREDSIMKQRFFEKER